MHTWISSKRVYSGISSKLTPFPSRSARCTVQCVNLAKSTSNSLPPVSQNLPTTSLFSPDRAPPRSFTLKNWTRFSYTPSKTDGQNRLIYRAGILIWRATKLHATCSKKRRKKIYKGGTTSKNPIREDTDRTSHGRKRKGREDSSPTNPKKGRSGKRKTKNAGHPSDRPTGGKTCLLHGPRHSTEECKVLKE